MAPNVAKVCNETFRSAFSTSFAVTNELFTTTSKQYDDINLEGEEEAEEVQATKKSISATSSNEQPVDRGMWSNQAEFFLSCMAYAVGIGNVWRFPYKCYKNGGGVFLIPYLVMLILAALPMFYMELVIGQFGRLGPNKVFGKIAPISRGLGYGMLCVTAYVAIYYNVIIAWSIFYTFASLTSKLPWSDCGNWFNTEHCFMPEVARSCEAQGQMWFNNSCTDTSVFCSYLDLPGSLNSTHCNSPNQALGPIDIQAVRLTVSPAEEYFKHYMLLMEKETSLDKLGGMNWRLVGCLALSWAICFACLIKGVKSAGKVVWFTALFPYLVLILLFFRGVTLEGAVTGIAFYVNPDWVKLLSVHVWTDAASQIFYSLGPAFGGLITLSSYNKRNHNCQRDAVLIAAVNSGTSVFAGFVIFSILGFMATELRVPVGEVVEGGTGLAFVAYPTAVTRLPAAPLWSFLFFTMLLTLGLDSQFTMVETLITAMYDELPWLRARQWLVVGATCLAGFILGLPMCLQGGYFIFVLMDWYSGSWSLIFLAVLEVILVAWVYGVQRLRRDIHHMGIQTSRIAAAYWEVTWRFACPFLLFSVMVASLVDYTPASEGEYLFPVWANAIGWCIALSSVLAVLPASALEVVRAVRRGAQPSFLFLPDCTWRNDCTNMAIRTGFTESNLSPNNKAESGVERKAAASTSM